MKNKRYQEIVSRIIKNKEYDLKEAIKLVKENATAKFDETIELAINLGVDPRKADQMVRGTVLLPNGLGKTVRVLVLTKGPKQAEATAAGADYVGFEEYIEKIKSGWTDVETIIATPDTMVEVGKLGKILGPRGLMPNPKTGTVTNDVARAVQEAKAGKVEFRVDKAGIVHMACGKASFSEEALYQNIDAALKAVLRLRPSTAKGAYIKKITLTSTMGAGITVSKSAATLG
ncbi:MAG: 50S ribosomal protein L1 [bacterium]|nr:50S ribosomal protein L1 [bacterium]